MTKEQEVIEYIEKRIKICNENADICDDNDFDEEAIYLREESYMLETVLNMIKEKDRQINSKNGTINALQSALKERTEERDRKDNIIARQRKQIDLMAEEINETDRGYTDYCEMKIECDRNCKDCIKRYFERNVRDE